MNEQFLRDFFNMPGAPKPISLRAYIATAALQGLLDRRDIGGSIPAHATLADTAVELADALLAELAK